MTLTRLKELSAAGYPVALAPEQMLEIINELEALRLRTTIAEDQVNVLKEYITKLEAHKTQIKRYERRLREYRSGKISSEQLLAQFTRD